MTQLNIQIEDQLARKFNALCDQRGKVQTSLISELIAKFVTKNEIAIDKRLSRADFSALTTLANSDDDA